MPISNDLHDSSSPATASAACFQWQTAPGAAALSLLFLDGPIPPAAFGGALANVDNIPRRVWLKDDTGNRIDEAMACREGSGCLLTLHGGPAVRRAMEQALAAAGIKEAPAFPFGRGVFAARTLSLLPQARGAGAVALVLEAAGQREALRRALIEPSGIPSLLSESSAARYLFDPPRVQLWGPVNAGKSSLLNALCGRPLAAVGAEPGLTRDVIEGQCEHAGFTIRLFDAPGVWTGGSELDAEAQRLADTWRREADLTIHLVPPGAEAASPDGGWVVPSRADEGSGAGVSIHDPASLQALKDRLLEHFFGALRRLPPERRFALHPRLREDLGNSPEAARVWLD
ncbi:MAG: 50S ribosome-binding GTPase [Planctomycetes bacterium]|nr:50S ribosome-binding GTPase [Planctomycetota bacterium]